MGVATSPPVTRLFVQSVRQANHKINIWTPHHCLCFRGIHRGMMDAPYNAHYNDVIMTTMASQITSLTVVYSTVYSDADQRKHQSSASLAFVWGIYRDRWILRTKGQLRGKCFHLMTSLCQQCGKSFHVTSSWNETTPILFTYTDLTVSFIQWNRRD